MTARILIVDDERDNRELLAIILDHEGFIVVTAASGAEALEIVAKQPPDLILVDIMMPDMDGYEVTAAIKSDPATKHVLVVMISALDDCSGRKLAQGAGAEDFFPKPMNRGELCQRVRTLVASCLASSKLLDGELATTPPDGSRERLA